MVNTEYIDNELGVPVNGEISTSFACFDITVFDLITALALISAQ